MLWGLVGIRSQYEYMCVIYCFSSSRHTQEEEERFNADQTDICLRIDTVSLKFRWDGPEKDPFKKDTPGNSVEGCQRTSLGNLFLNALPDHFISAWAVNRTHTPGHIVTINNSHTIKMYKVIASAC